MPRTPLAFELDQVRKKRPCGDAVAIQGRVVVGLGYQLLHGRRTERAQGAQDLVLALEPVNDHETDVTNYCDWTAIPDDIKTRVQWPIVPVTMLEQSVEKLERVATTR